MSDKYRYSLIHIYKCTRTHGRQRRRRRETLARALGERAARAHRQTCGLLWAGETDGPAHGISACTCAWASKATPAAAIYWLSQRRKPAGSQAHKIIKCGGTILVLHAATRNADGGRDRRPLIRDRPAERARIHTVRSVCALTLARPLRPQPARSIRLSLASLLGYGRSRPAGPTHLARRELPAHQEQPLTFSAGRGDIVLLA